MRRILAIFRKDARHLWPQAAALAFLMALAALLDPAYSRGPALYYDLVPSFALPLACWLLVISAIHQENLPGDRQYWLTRPYSRAELAAAKFLFIVTFVNLPLLLYHLGVYLALGVPPADHLAALFWRQVFFTAFYILPATALASITRTLGRVVVTALFGGVVFWIAGNVISLLTRHYFLLADAPSVQMALERAAVLAVGASIILALQYARRATALSGIVAAAVALAFMAVAVHGPAYSYPPSNFSGAAPQLSLDRDDKRHSTMTPPGDPNLSAFDIPVDLRGLPAGEQLDQAYMNLRVAMPGTRFAATYPNAQLHGLSHGRAWLSFVADIRLVVQSQPRILSGSFYLQLFDGVTILPLPRGSAVVVPAVGACRDSVEPGGSISFSCYSPRARAAVMAGIPGVRANWIVSPGSVQNSIPTAFGFQPLTKFASMLPYSNWSELSGLHLITARPLPLVRVSFQLPPVLLRDYLVTGRR
jgi:ABC-type transport system involved in multi-copper enzyme maturation permease subunit